MAFAKFNVCSPCCSTINHCHPYTAAQIVNPSTGAASPTSVDLTANLELIPQNFVPTGVDEFGQEIGVYCLPGPSIFPTGGYFSPSFGISFSGVPFCVDPWLFSTIQCPNLNYDGSIIDLYANLTSPQQFNKYRDPRASAIYYGTFPIFNVCDIHTTCPCYEVGDNQSSAWDTVKFTLYPSMFAGFSGGTLFGHPYVSCGTTYERCVADLCNEPSGDRVKVELPYCLNYATIINPHPDAFGQGNQITLGYWQFVF